MNFTELKEQVETDNRFLVTEDFGGFLRLKERFQSSLDSWSYRFHLCINAKHVLEMVEECKERQSKRKFISYKGEK
jgi:hypothetical protein